VYFSFHIKNSRVSLGVSTRVPFDQIDIRDGISSGRCSISIRDVRMISIGGGISRIPELDAYGNGGWCRAVRAHVSVWVFYARCDSENLCVRGYCGTLHSLLLLGRFEGGGCVCCAYE